MDQAAIDQEVERPGGGHAIGVAEGDPAGAGFFRLDGPGDGLADRGSVVGETAATESGVSVSGGRPGEDRLFGLENLADFKQHPHVAELNRAAGGAGGGLQHDRQPSGGLRGRGIGRPGNRKVVMHQHAIPVNGHPGVGNFHVPVQAGDGEIDVIALPVPGSEAGVAVGRFPLIDSPLPRPATVAGRGEC